MPTLYSITWPPFIKVTVLEVLFKKERLVNLYVEVSGGKKAGESKVELC